MMKSFPIQLDPCPFCGGRLYEDAWDRGISIGCEPCGYHRHYNGLLQNNPNYEGQICVPVSVRGQVIEPTSIPNGMKEYYHCDIAREREEYEREQEEERNAKAADEYNALCEAEYNDQCARWHEEMYEQYVSAEQEEMMYGPGGEQ